MNAGDSGSKANIDNLLEQMSRGVSVLNGWDAVLNIDEDLVNAIFQAQFAQFARADWKEIRFAFCQLFPNPGKQGKLAVYTAVQITLATPRLRFLGNNQAFVEITFKATGRTGTAAKAVAAGFDPGKDGDPDDPGLEWDYNGFSDMELNGQVPLSAVAGTSHNSEGATRFVLDFPAGSFTSRAFEHVKDPDELCLRLKNYFDTHNVQYVINSIRTDLIGQIPQLAPKSFRIAVLTTNENKNIFQIFIATQSPAGRNLTVGVNEPIPDGFNISAMFNKRTVSQLGTSLMVQTWLFMQSNLVFSGHSTLSLGPELTPGDALILGSLAVDSSPSPVDPIIPVKERPMLNIQKTMQIKPDGLPSFTAYGDDLDPAVWYVPPAAVWAVNPVSRLPQISVIKYNLTGGAISGFCRFTVQLMVDAAQEAALKKAIPGAKLGQFDWISSRAFFTYTVGGKSTTIPSQPSSFGSQAATFSLTLENEKELADFVNAFSSGSSSGAFGISYELAAETRLPAVKVISTFDSTVAYQYQVENRYRIEMQYHTDTWGHRRSEQVSVYVGTFVHEMIRQSQSAKVTVIPGQGLTPALLSMCQDWANRQLQKDVEQAINNALSLIRNPTGNFSMTNVSSFTHTLETNNIVPWYFQVEGTLPPMSPEVWKQLYSEVNQQQLQVTFQLQEDLARHGISRVNLKFQYDDAVPPKVHTFDAQSQDAWYISMPALFDGGKFIASYKYQYEVIYAPPADRGPQPAPLSTEWITSNLTQVNFGLVELGLLAVTFTAANIEWGTTTAEGAPPSVKEITVSWNWVPGNGGPVLSESFVLTAKNPSLTSTLRSVGPTNNQQYRYSLTFLMSDGNTLAANGLAGASQICRINHPLSTISVGVLPLFSDSVKAVVLRATFDDEKNDIHLAKQWTARATAQSGGTVDESSFTPWDFQAVAANLNMATVVFSGTWVDGKGKQHAIPKSILVGSNSTLLISDTQRVATAVIDASNVSFVPPKRSGVYRVEALVSDYESTAQSDDLLANAKTLVFGQDEPSVQYYQTDAIGISETPTFCYQYVYTVNKDQGEHTDVVKLWPAPQSTVSTSLPVIPGSPAARITAGVVRAARIHDGRTAQLFARHDAAWPVAVEDEKALVGI